jgi:hypothetical protein
MAAFSIEHRSTTVDDGSDRNKAGEAQLGRGALLNLAQ